MNWLIFIIQRIKFTLISCSLSLPTPKAFISLSFFTIPDIFKFIPFVMILHLKVFLWLIDISAQALMYSFNKAKKAFAKAKSNVRREFVLQGGHPQNVEPIYKQKDACYCYQGEIGIGWLNAGKPFDVNEETSEIKEKCENC